MKVLLVEDYKPVRVAVAKAAREMGWVVDEASDGEEGLWFAESHAHDVIVLDLMLPKISGLNVLRAIRARNLRTPVLILTAKDGVDDRVNGLDLGADDYLVKPFFVGELLSRLRALVRRTYPEMRPVMRVGDLEVDTNARRLSLDGVEVAVTAREYALVEYLARRQGQVVTRGEIWTHVYESYGESTSNVVDVYVGYLRRKLHRPGRVPLIHTRRGLGYVLQAE